MEIYCKFAKDAIVQGKEIFLFMEDNCDLVILFFFEFKIGEFFTCSETDIQHDK